MSFEKLFEFGGMWIGRVSGSAQLYRFWYDSRNGEVRRRSLKTKDFEEAKKRLAEIVVNDAPVKADDPEHVPLVYVLTHYIEGHADALPSSHMARRASELVMQFLEQKCGFDSSVKTSQFSSIYQAEFVVWCRSEFGHSPAYVSRMLSVVAAACKFSAKTKLIKSVSGELKEAKLLRFVPEVNYDSKWVAGIMRVAEPRPRDYVPTYEELAALLDLPSSEVLSRYDIIALNTWARPTAVVDLNAKLQIDFENGLLDLNPPNRRQNKKQRPLIRLTSNLKDWLEHWAEDRPLSYNRILKDGSVERVAATHVKAQFNRRSTHWMLQRAGFSDEEIKALVQATRRGDTDSMLNALHIAETKGIRRITRYTLRHFMATRVRGLTESNVGREQRSLWLGHGKQDATSWYETHDPEFLRECAHATDIVIEKLSRLMKRCLIAPSTQKVTLVDCISRKQGKAA